MNHIVKLNWDSDFFGFAVGRMDEGALDSTSLEEALRKAKSNGFHMLYWFANAESHNKKTASELGGLLVDRKVTYVLRTANFKSLEVNHKVESYPSTEPDNNLLNLALSAGAYSRFLIDPHFGRPTFERLYHQWIRNSCLRRIAEDVLVIKQDGQIVAMLTIGEKNGRADIGLVASAQAYRGMGMGSDLVKSFINWGLERNYDQLQVVTQRENMGACRLYEKNGFELASELHVFHFWL